jgi:hypothetical protein
LSPVADAELGEDVGEVVLDGLAGDGQCLGDLGVRQAAGGSFPAQDIHVNDIVGTEGMP